MLMFPMWAWDDWLDLHAAVAGIERRPAGYASGKSMLPEIREP